MGIREQAQDWKYLVSKANHTSRGFYIMCTVVFALLLLATTVSLIAAIAGILTGTWRIVGFVGLPVVLLLLVGFVKITSR